MEHAAALLDRYSVGANKQYRASSLNVYGAILGKLESLALAAGETLLTVSPRTLHRFVEMHEHPNTAKRYACFLDDFYDWFQKKGELATSPAYGLREKYSYPEQATRTEGFINEADEIAFLASLPPPSHWKHVRDAALMALTVGTGLKLKEVLRLLREDVFLDQKPPVVLVHHGSHSREVPIRPLALPYLLRWEAVRREYHLELVRECFPATVRGGALGPSGVYRQVRSALLRAGLTTLGSLGPSALRVSYGKREAAEGNAVPILQHRLGHVRQASTLRLLGQLEP